MTGKTELSQDLVNWPVLAILAMCYLLTILAFPFAPSVLEAVLYKEGPIEHLTHITLLGGVLCSIYLISAYCRAWRYGLFGLFQAVFLLEEIDWGQLIWEFPTPDWVLALGNRSDRLNFHNNNVGELIFVLIVVSTFLIVPAWRRYKHKSRPIRSAADLPLVSYSQFLSTLTIGIGTLVATAGGHFLSSGLDAEPIVQELSDFLFSVIVTWVSLAHLLAWRGQNNCS